MQPEEFADRFAVSRETIERLRIYEALLQLRGQSLSLVGRSTLTDIWFRHFADSAQLFSMIGDRVPLLDMGTGAGFPGMVLAIMGLTNVHLSDNNQKKVDFLHEVARETATPVTIHNCKAEAIRGVKFSTITARAFAPLNDLITISTPLLQPGGQMLFLKGRKAVDELTEARRHWRFDAESLSSVTSDESAIVRLTGIADKAVA